MAKNNLIDQAFKSAQGLLQRPDPSFEPSTMVTKEDTENLLRAINPDQGGLRVMNTNLDTPMQPYEAETVPLPQTQMNIEETRKEIPFNLSEKEINNMQNEAMRGLGRDFYDFQDSMRKGGADLYDMYERITGNNINNTKVDAGTADSTNKISFTDSQPESDIFNKDGIMKFIPDAYQMQNFINPDTNKLTEFHSLMQNLENSKKVGWNGKHWTPHKSAEEGNPTIAYGHKLTDAEKAGNFVLIGGVEVPFEDVNEARAQELYMQDFTEAEQIAQGWFGDDWDSLDPKAKNLASELVFNMGPSVTQGKTEYKKFKRKAIEGKGYLSEIGRTYKRKGKVIPLTRRVNALKKYAR